MEQEDSFVESVGVSVGCFAFNGFGISYYWNNKNYAGAWVTSWN